MLKVDKDIELFCSPASAHTPSHLLQLCHTIDAHLFPRLDFSSIDAGSFCANMSVIDQFIKTHGTAEEVYAHLMNDEECGRYFVEAFKANLGLVDTVGAHRVYLEPEIQEAYTSIIGREYEQERCPFKSEHDKTLYLDAKMRILFNAIADNTADYFRSLSSALSEQPAVAYDKRSALKVLQHSCQSKLLNIRNSTEDIIGFVCRAIDYVPRIDRTMFLLDRIITFIFEHLRAFRQDTNKCIFRLLCQDILSMEFDDAPMIVMDGAEGEHVYLSCSTEKLVSWSPDPVECGESTPIRRSVKTGNRILVLFNLLTIEEFVKLYQKDLAHCIYYSTTTIPRELSRLNRLGHKLDDRYLNPIRVMLDDWEQSGSCGALVRSRLYWPEDAIDAAPPSHSYQLPFPELRRQAEASIDSRMQLVWRPDLEIAVIDIEFANGTFEFTASASAVLFLTRFQEEQESVSERGPDLLYWLERGVLVASVDQQSFRFAVSFDPIHLSPVPTTLRLCLADNKA